MGQTKRLLQRRLEHWRTTAAQWIGGTEDDESIEEPSSPVQETEEAKDEARWIELKPAVYERCKTLAEAQRTTVDKIVHQIIEQYWASRSGDLMTPISREQQERNPLLQLDALSKRNFRPMGEQVYEAE